MGQLQGEEADVALMVSRSFFGSTVLTASSSVIAVNLLSTDEILRAGRSSSVPFLSSHDCTNNP